MARGWESKSVESQQEGVELTKTSGRVLAADREGAAKLKSLELSRTRVVHELQTARSDVHRTALENALRFLDSEIARLRG